MLDTQSFQDKILAAGQTKGEAKVSPMDVFAEPPVDLTEFVTGKDYLANPPLSDIQYHAVRHLEQIYLPETYEALVERDEYWEPWRFVNFAYLEWGKGSGKDHVCRVATARIIYLLMCLKSPLSYFGMPTQDWIHTINVAASAQQAHRVFFTPLKEMFKASPWFKGKFHATEYSVKFPSHHIEAISGHSESEQQEGLNPILAIADEISAFKTREEVQRHIKQQGGREPGKTAESILNMLRSSARTRFPRNFKLAAISYPRFAGDAIEQLIAQGRADNEKYGIEEPKTEDRGLSRVYVDGPRATWEVNPRIEGPEDFREDYDSDPIEARAKYECKPDKALNRFFRNDVAIYSAFHGIREPEPVEIEYYWGQDTFMPAPVNPDTGESVVPEVVEGWQVKFHFDEDLIPYYGASYALHGDIGITGDRAGVAMAHVRKYQQGEWDAAQGFKVIEDRPIVKVDFVTSFASDIKGDPPREVQIRWYRKLVWELLAKGFNIELMTFDGFQSTDSIQILESWGIESRRVSMDVRAEPWDNLRDVMYDGRLEVYERHRTIEEIRSLQRLGNGKVDHPPGGSKDEADAICGAVLGAVELGGDEGDQPVRADQPSGVDEFMTGSHGGSLADFGVLDGSGFGKPLEGSGFGQPIL